MLLKHAKNILKEFVQVGGLVSGALNSANSLATGGPVGLAAYATNVVANKMKQSTDRRKAERIKLTNRQKSLEKDTINPNSVGPNNSAMNG